jgi:hypothetical protein
MKTTIRVVALLWAVSVTSGCTNGLIHHNRRSEAIQLPAAPMLDPSPEETGTVGSPSPAKAMPPPAASPFDGD